MTTDNWTSPKRGFQARHKVMVGNEPLKIDREQREEIQRLNAHINKLDAEIERLQANIKTIHTQKEADIRRLAIECGKANDGNKQDIIARARSKSPYLQGSSAERLIDELAAEVEGLREQVSTLRELREYDRVKIERLQAARAALEPKP